MTNAVVTFTPRELVAELDRHIVGQGAAKRAVAIALRNRWRRQQVKGDLKDEITPKNIIMIGPTGVGKTEIARRLAKLAKAPFVKVEASKFTEVGYVGRDVESMIRDLVEVSVKLVQEEEMASVKDRARELAEERLLDKLLPESKRPSYEELSDGKPTSNSTREKMRKLLRDGHLDDREVEVETADTSMPMADIFASSGMGDLGMNMKEAFGNMFPKKTKTRRVSVKDAIDLLANDEARKLTDQDKVVERALERAQQSGIIFLDEIDKVAGGSSKHGPDVSREGVQRDLLPIVEGSTVNTKHGMVKTDHILFIAAGAFHISKVSDLIPELQGRFPIRVELERLTKEDFIRILSEPENSLTKQYEALLATEGLKIGFTEDGIDAIAEMASQVNERQENIGARRLHTVVERLLDEVSFNAPDMDGVTLSVDKAFVDAALKDIVEDPQLENYIL